MICIVCPRGCRITAEQNADGEIRVDGAGCPRGSAYAREELTNPVRMVTTTVAISGAIHPRLPVRSAAPVPKASVRDVVRELARVQAVSPIARGDVVARNVAGSGVDIIASRDM